MGGGRTTCRLRHRHAINLTAVETNFRHGRDVPDAHQGTNAERTFGAVMPARWRRLRSGPLNGLRNMAIDAALLDRAAQTGEGVWRCYAWERPTVSFGRNEAIVGRVTTDSLASAGLDAVRRPTGGRALLHAREVTYSVTLPLTADIPWRVPYALVNAVLLDALRALGVHASLVTAADAVAVAPDGPVCFERPAAGEIAVHGAKLVGSAVWRERGAYLQHGSILLHDDQALLQRATTVPSALPLPPAATLAACAGAIGRPCPTWTDVADALERALVDTLDRVGYASDKLTGEGPIASWGLDGEVPFDTTVAAREEGLARSAWLWRR